MATPPQHSDEFIYGLVDDLVRKNPLRGKLSTLVGMDTIKRTLFAALGHGFRTREISKLQADVDAYLDILREDDDVPSRDTLGRVTSKNAFIEDAQDGSDDGLVHVHANSVHADSIHADSIHADSIHANSVVSSNHANSIVASTNYANSVVASDQGKKLTGDCERTEPAAGIALSAASSQSEGIPTPASSNDDDADLRSTNARLGGFDSDKELSHSMPSDLAVICVKEGLGQITNKPAFFRVTTPGSNTTEFTNVAIPYAKCSSAFWRLAKLGHFTSYVSKADFEHSQKMFPPSGPTPESKVILLCDDYIRETEKGRLEWTANTANMLAHSEQTANPANMTNITGNSTVDFTLDQIDQVRRDLKAYRQKAEKNPGVGSSESKAKGELSAKAAGKKKMEEPSEDEKEKGSTSVEHKAKDDLTAKATGKKKAEEPFAGLLRSLLNESEHRDALLTLVETFENLTSNFPEGVSDDHKKHEALKDEKNKGFPMRKYTARETLGMNASPVRELTTKENFLMKSAGYNQIGNPFPLLSNAIGSKDTRSSLAERFRKFGERRDAIISEAPKPLTDSDTNDKNAADGNVNEPRLRSEEDVKAFYLKKALETAQRHFERYKAASAIDKQSADASIDYAYKRLMDPKQRASTLKNEHAGIQLDEKCFSNPHMGFSPVSPSLSYLPHPPHYPFFAIPPTGATAQNATDYVKELAAATKKSKESSAELRKADERLEALEKRLAALDIEYKDIAGPSKSSNTEGADIWGAPHDRDVPAVRKKKSQCPNCCKSMNLPGECRECGFERLDPLPCSICKKDHLTSDCDQKWTFQQHRDYMDYTAGWYNCSRVVKCRWCEGDSCGEGESWRGGENADFEVPSTPTTTAGPKSISKDLKVTYWARIESGENTMQIPIDSKDVSGREKEIAMKSMPKVWKWVCESKLGDKVGLVEAFKLAKDMHEEDVKEENGARWGFSFNDLKAAKKADVEVCNSWGADPGPSSPQCGGGWGAPQGFTF